MNRFDDVNVHGASEHTVSASAGLMARQWWPSDYYNSSSPNKTQFDIKLPSMLCAQPSTSFPTFPEFMNVLPMTGMHHGGLGSGTPFNSSTPFPASKTAGLGDDLAGARVDSIGRERRPRRSNLQNDLCAQVLIGQTFSSYAPDSLARASNGALQRGKACISCRRRKMKCDGIKPICGPCNRSNKAEDCEYTDSQGRTRTQELQETIARLEARIKELETPDDEDDDDLTDCVKLHNPHGAHTELQIHGNTTPDIDSILSDCLTSVLPSLSQSLAPSNSSLSWWQATEPPADVAQTLINIFLPHCSQFGFFLNKSRFLQSAALDRPVGHPERPLPALLSAMYLMGVLFSDSPDLRQHEPALLSRVLHNLSSALADSHPNKIMHTAQAEMLLAHYFFRNGRLLEGRYHVSAAVSLAMSCGLNRLHSELIPRVEYAYSGGIELRPARDTVEEGERINGFWIIFTADKLTAAAVGIPSALPNDETLGTQVDTPWPMDFDAPEQCIFSDGAWSSQTIQRFLDGRDDQGNVQGQSIGTAFSKATILFSRAATLTSLWRPGISSDVAYRNRFAALEYRLQQFVSGLLPLNPNFTHFMTIDMFRYQLVGYVLAHAAVIRLHDPYAASDVRAHRKCFDSASAVATAFRTVDVGTLYPIHPILPTLCMIVCLFLVRDITAYRSGTAPWIGTAADMSEEVLLSLLNQIHGAMIALSPECPHTVHQLTELQNVRARAFI